MTVPCVRVPRERGEDARQELGAAGLLSETHDVGVRDEWIYIPVADPEAVPPAFTVEEFDAPERDTQTMPADLLGFEPSYERLGDIVIVDEDDPERAADIAEAIMASDIRAKTVLNRASKVKGVERVRDWEVLAGDGTETVHREYGHEFALDIASVYFSPRLATERHRVIEQVGPGETVFDMFAGVGPYAIPMAVAGAEVVATDVNAEAIQYLEQNAVTNGVADSITARHGDVRTIAADYRDWASRIVMNLPHSADEFLETAIELASETCHIHYYDIQHESAPFEPGETAIRAAAGADYEVSIENRRVVRTYAPHEVNVVIDARVDRQP